MAVSYHVRYYLTTGSSLVFSILPNDTSICGQTVNPEISGRADLPPEPQP